MSHRLGINMGRFFSTRGPGILYQRNILWAHQQMASIPREKKIILAQTDGAGTVFDPYCIAPFAAFSKIFGHRNLHLTHAQITGPMGIKKIDHIKHLLFRELSVQWKALYGHAPTENDVTKLHDEFIAELDSTIADFSAPTLYTDLAVAFFRRHGILSALTSGYSRSTFNLAASKLNALYPFATSTTADEVAEGTRIAMLEKNMYKLNLSGTEMERVIFFTDAYSDVLNVCSAEKFPWIIGVSDYSTHVGITSKKQLANSTAQDIEKQRQTARQLLLAKGAHIVIGNMSEAPFAIVAANHALLQGKKPHQIQTLSIKYPQYEETLSIGNRI